MRTMKDGDKESIALGRSVLVDSAVEKTPSIFSKVWQDMKTPFAICGGVVVGLMIIGINAFACMWVGHLIDDSIGSTGIGLSVAIFLLLVSAAIWWYILAVANIWLTENVKGW